MVNIFQLVFSFFCCTTLQPISPKGNQQKSKFIAVYSGRFVVNFIYSCSVVIKHHSWVVVIVSALRVDSVFPDILLVGHGLPQHQAISITLVLLLTAGPLRLSVNKRFVYSWEMLVEVTQAVTIQFNLKGKHSSLCRKPNN